MSQVEWQEAMKSSEIRIDMKVKVIWFSQMFLKSVDETGMFLSIFCHLFLKPGPDHALV